MDPIPTVPVCAPAPSDTIAMVVVAGVFLLGWWGFRRWKKRR
ncbi:MAG: hypothetical protein ABFR33_04255 [Verrucomicrobiota bacterium]